MAVKRLYQIIADAEDQSGQGFATSRIVATTFADFLVIDPQLTFDPEQFTRANINRGGSLSPFVPLAGVSPGQASFGVEVAGASSLPAWSTFLEGCGMVRAIAERIPLTGSITNGPFKHGELVTGGTSSATAYVVHDTYDGATGLLVRDVSGGPFQAETITGEGSSPATVSSSGANATNGFCWYPTGLEEYRCAGCSLGGGTVSAGDVLLGATSGAYVIASEDYTSGAFRFRTFSGFLDSGGETLNNQTQSGSVVVPALSVGSNPAPTAFGSLSLGLIEDGLLKLMKGARGSFSVGFELGGPMIANFTYTGLKDTIEDWGALPGVSFTSLKPKGMIGITFTIGDDTISTVSGRYSPRINSFNFDQGQTIGIARDANESLGLYGAARATGRECTGSMNITVEPEARHDFIAALHSGAIQNVSIEFQTAVNDAWKMTFPGATLTGESSGEEQGIGTRDFSIQFGSRAPDGTDSDGAEIVISYDNVT